MTWARLDCDEGANCYSYTRLEQVTWQGDVLSVSHKHGYGAIADATAATDAAGAYSNDYDCNDDANYFPCKTWGRELTGRCV